ncbi:MAG: hypothetical protein WC526_01275 [Patescibacteria group bacterium]
MATAKQIPFLMGRLVEHQFYFCALSTASATWASQNPKDAIALCVAAIENRQKERQSDPAPSPLLTLVGAVVIWLAVRFVASEHLVKNTEKNAPVKISYIFDKVTVWFQGKIEERVEGEMALCCHTLNSDSDDNLIINQLGGETKAETALAEVFACLEKQPNGEDGALLTNGHANIFYVRNTEGVLCVIQVIWRGDGWTFYTRSVGSLDTCTEGRRVFSRAA